MSMRIVTQTELTFDSADTRCFHDTSWLAAKVQLMRTVDWIGRIEWKRGLLIARRVGARALRGKVEVDRSEMKGFFIDSAGSAR